jgi:DNA-binding response OmpR family regulator
MSPQPRVLVVDDDPGIRTSIRLALHAAGYRVLEAADGAAGLQLAQQEKPALIILDVRMPGLDGLSVAAELRRVGAATPILMLTSQVQVTERVAGLDAGADDYLGKPFDRRELLARVQALLRRVERATERPKVLQFDDVTVDLERKSATRGGAPLALTRTELALLDLLARHLGKPVSRDLMLDAVWGYTYFPSSRTIDTHVWRLRKKLGDTGEAPRWITKVHGEGYVLRCSGTA